MLINVALTERGSASPPSLLDSLDTYLVMCLCGTCQRVNTRPLLQAVSSLLGLC